MLEITRQAARSSWSVDRAIPSSTGPQTSTNLAHQLTMTSSAHCYPKAILSKVTPSNRQEDSHPSDSSGFYQVHLLGGCRLNVYPGELDKLSMRNTFSLQPAHSGTFVAKVGG